MVSVNVTENKDSKWWEEHWSEKCYRTKTKEVKQKKKGRKNMDKFEDFSQAFNKDNQK
jgi:hypothetical protein